MSLVQLADYKTTLGISSTTENGKLTQYSLEIDAKVKAFLGYDIEETVYTEEVYDGTGSHYLFPKAMPVTIFTKLEIYEGLDSLGAEDWEEWTQNDEYERLVIQRGGEILYISGVVFPAGIQNIRITYTAGYTVDTLPQDIQSVCKELMYLKYQGIDQKKLGTTSKSRNEGGVSSTVSFENLEDETLKKIAHYQLVRV